ncbi:uncharacterized protein [Engystomops pustulosus]|uniref:uncharacterized protein n=1 Tax=Engystomops pustulosus TaxID=76066 RepID=UPI003AFB1B2E
MDRDNIPEKILKLTLEIIYLLTGEDYSVVNKAGDPGRMCRTARPPPLSEVCDKNNNQKILEVTKKMVELLSGEVPIRHEDIIVCFSMEEWEYVEGHKDLYKDLITEDHPVHDHTDLPSSDNLSLKLNFPSLSPDASGEDHSNSDDSEDVQEVAPQKAQSPFTPVSSCTQYRQIGPAGGGGGGLCADVEDDDVVYMPTEDPQRGCPSRSYDGGRHSDSDCCLLTEQIQNSSDHRTGDVGCAGDGVLIVDNVYTSTDLTNHSREWVTDVNLVGCPITPQHVTSQYSTSCVIEVASICEEGNVTSTDVYYPTDPKTSLYVSDKVEDAPESWGTDVIYTNMYTPSGLTPADLASIKKELISWRDGSLQLQNRPMGERAVSSGCQEDGSRDPTDAYPSPRIKTEYDPEGSADHYTTLRHSQVPYSHADFIKEEKVSTDLSAGNENLRQQLYSCSDCKKYFSSESNLSKHRPMCKGRKPHICSRCGKCFASASYLVIHERIHTGEKPYSCTHCGKSFTRKPDLIRHERIHTGEKPFACPECGKRFTSVSNIFMHRRIHTGEKPFACSECGKRFIKKSDLARHEKIHLPQKPVPCPQCGKLFGSKIILGKHMAVHTVEAPDTAQGAS